ncbi:pilus assembly protein TadE, partial [Streptomyces sp. NPDC006450]
MRRSDRGYVTAEAALVIPALVLFAALLVWAVRRTGNSAGPGAGAETLTRHRSPDMLASAGGGVRDEAG